MNLRGLYQFPLALLFACSASALQAQNSEDFIDAIMQSNTTARRASQSIANLGLNCSDPENIAIFMKELRKALQGIGNLTSEAAIQLGNKADYPTVCNVLTNEQIKSYSESNEISKKSECLVKDPFGGCAMHQHTTTERPHPQYYWPKYFVEVTDKGNDSDPAFAKSNALYTSSRKIARSLGRLMDSDGALKIAAAIFGGSHVLGAIGIDADAKVNPSDFLTAASLTPFEAMRIRANHQKTMSTFEANIWPVGISESVAEKFTVCGPQLKEQGKSPGGYAWPFKGVPMTCPVAMSRDAAPFWDTGMLDYLDPQAMAQMAAATNPLSCGGLAAMNALGDQNQSFRDKAGDQLALKQATSSMPQDWRQALVGCSFPILGSSEAIAKKTMSLMDAAKWQGPYCTLWGPLAPRMSGGVYGSDYSFANAGLRFKTLAHELFGVPRGDSERWSLAYPWEGPGSITDGKGNGFAAFKGQISETLKGWGIPYSPTAAKSRSEGLFKPGDPILVDMSSSARLAKDTISHRAGEFGYLAALSTAGAVAGRQAMEKARKNTDSTEHAYAIGAAAVAGTWVAAEAARARNGDLFASGGITGDRRIYTIWEKVQCSVPSAKLTIATVPVKVVRYESCEAAIRFEVYKFLQLELLRKVCDWMGRGVGW